MTTSGAHKDNTTTRATSMHRASALALSLILAGCSSTIPRIKHVSLKDAGPAKAAAVEPVSSFQGFRPITVTGASAETNRAVALAMFHAVNLDRIPINTPESNWTLQGKLTPGITIVWTVRDEAGNDRGQVKLTAPAEDDLKTTASALASASFAGLKPLIPRSVSPPPRQGIRL